MRPRPSPSARERVGQLTDVVKKLKELAGKKLGRFAGATVAADDLDFVINFLANLKSIVGNKDQTVRLSNGDAIKSFHKFSHAAKGQISAALGNNIDTAESTERPKLENAKLEEATT